MENLPTELNLGMLAGVELHLINPYTTSAGKTYYLLDLSRDGAVTTADSVGHATLDVIFNWGADVSESQTSGAVAGVDDQRTVVIGAYTLVVPSLAELAELKASLSTSAAASWNLNNNYAAADGGSDVHQLYNLSTGVQISNNGDTAANNLKGLVALQVLYAPTASSDGYLSGTNDNDSLLGSAGSNYLEGRAGNDTLDGGSAGYDMAGYSLGTLSVAAINGLTLIKGVGQTWTLSSGGDPWYSFAQASDGSAALIVTDLRANPNAGTQTGTDRLLNMDAIVIDAQYVDSAGAVQYLRAADIQISTVGTALNLSMNTTGLMLGSNGNDYLQGSAYGDRILAGAGQDTVLAGDGNDLIEVKDALGGDVVDGGAGFDTLMLHTEGAAVTLGANAHLVEWFQINPVNSVNQVVTLNNDVFRDMTANSAVTVGIWGNSGAQMNASAVTQGRVNVDGSDGADLLVGSSNSDWFNGHAGNDSLTGGGGYDSFFFDMTNPAWIGQDVVTDFMADSNELVFGGLSSNLSLLSSGSAANLTQGQLLVVQGNNAATVYLGTDSVAGADLTVTLNGTGLSASNLSVSNTTNNGVNDGRLIYTYGINGTNNADSLVGTQGNDKLFGNDGNDTLNGGAGNDSLYGGNGNDLMLGGLGDDRFYGNVGSDTIDGGEQRRQVWVTGTSADYDRLDYSSTQGVSVDLTARTVSVINEVGVDQYINIEEIQGAKNAADVITGRTSASIADFSTGGSGSVYLYLRGGSDTVNITPYGPSMLYLLGGATVGYHWSATGINLFYQGANASVTYSADTSSGQVAGQDRLTHVGSVGSTSFNDTMDFRLATRAQYGFSSNAVLNNQLVDSASLTAVLGYGGNDTVLGNGLVTLDFSSVNGSSNGRGLFIDLAGSWSETKTADLSNLYSTATGSQIYNGELTYSGVRGVVGTWMDDTLLGGGNNNDIELFYGGGGNDYIDGRSGYDRADYNAERVGGIQVVLASGQVNTPSVGTDTLRSIENIGGTQFDDVYDARGFVTGVSSVSNQGSSANGFNEFMPRGGNDTIFGNGNTRISYEAGVMGVVVDLGGGYADARLEADKSSPAYMALLGRDTLMGGVSEVRGSNQDDLLIGGGQGRTTNGSGFEFFTGMVGNDTINGHGGFDFALYTGSPAGIEVDMRKASEQVQDGYAWTDPLNGSVTRYFDTLISVESIQASYFADIAYGGAGPLYFSGRQGADSLVAGTGYTEAQYDSDPAGVTVLLKGWVGAGAVPVGFDGSARDGWGDVDLLQGVRGVEGSAFADRIVGGDGDDDLDGRGGSDTIDGGAGSDWVEYNQSSSGVQVDLSLGTAYDGQGGMDALSNVENVRGGNFNDTLIGNDAGNVFEGGAGDDVIDGGAGGVDTAKFSGRVLDYAIHYTGVNGVWEVRDLRGASTFDALSGSWTAFDGTDQLKNIEVLSFQDVSFNLSGFNPIMGTSGNDTLNGTGGADWIQGLDGNDQLNGGAGNDVLLGGDGSNILTGGAGDDTLSGGTRGLSGLQSDYTQVSYSAATSAITATFGAADGSSALGRVVGDASVGTDTVIHADRITGSAFADTFTINSNWYGSQLNNSQFLEVTGGGGNDIIVGNDFTRIGYSDSSTPVNVVFSTTLEGSGTATRSVTDVDMFSAVSQVRGSSGNDTLQGGLGNQFFRPGGGNDTVDGDAGDGDAVEYFNANEGVTVSLAVTTAQLVSASEGTDVLRNIEVLRGSYYADSLTGGAGNETLSGYDGNDTLDGGLGTNVLWGGAGNDQLIGTQRTLDGVFGGVSGIDFNVASYNSATGPIQVVMGVTATTGTVTGDASVGNDTLTRMDGIKGTDFDDSFVVTADWAGSQFKGYGPGSTMGVFFDVRPGAGNDVITGNGYTRLSYLNESTAPISVRFITPGAGTVIGADVGVDTFTGVNSIRATNADDQIYGSDADEIFRPEGGDDTVDGSGGRDRVDYKRSSDSVTVNLALATAQYVSASQGTDLLLNIEDVQGSILGNDSLTGNAGDNRLVGDGGNDTLNGMGGFDTAIYSGAYADYRIETNSAGVTTVTDLRNNGLVNDGVDTLTNVEALSFSDTTFMLGQTFVKVDPAGTYLNDSSSDAANVPTRVNLSSLGVAAGDLLYLKRMGDYMPGVGSSFSDTSTGMVAEFLDSAGTRVAPAVYLKTTTSNQSNGAVTDVAEDFDLNSGTNQLQVPVGATQIQFSARDIFYSDNSDPDNDYGVNLRRLANYSGTDGNDNMYGTSADDTLEGGAGSDYLMGGIGNDVLRGGLGDDYLYGNSGSDTLDGGEQRRLPGMSTSGDYDRVRYTGTSGLQVDLSNRTIQQVGETGVDTYKGVEEIQGILNVKDVVTGRITATASDVLDGGTGMGLWLQGGNDEVIQVASGYQQPWSDGVTVSNNWAQSSLNIVGSGNLILVNYTASGTQSAGQDRLVNVTIFGDGKYNDTIDLRNLTTNNLGYLTDPLNEKSYNTVLLGNGGSDTVYGNGQTTLYLGGVSAAADSITGATVDLKLTSANLSNLTGSGSNATMGMLTFSGVRGLLGTKYNDTLIGGLANNDAFESFRGDGGDDFIDGGSGWDRADYRSSMSGVTVTMAAGVVDSTFAGHDTLRSIEAVRGSMFDDVYDARGFVGGKVSTTANVGSYWYAFNEFSPDGGNDQVYGNGATRLTYELAMVGVKVDLGAGVAQPLYDVNDPVQAQLALASVGEDYFGAVSDVRGSANDDLLLGGGAGRVYQTTHVEYFKGGAGQDTIDGLAGLDWVQYDNSPEAIEVDMRLATGQVLHDGWGASDTLRNIEVIMGSAQDDKVTAGAGNLTFSGFAGSDRFVGNAQYLDRIDYSSDLAGVYVRMTGWVGATGALATGYTGSGLDSWGNIDQFSGVSGINGSNFSDTLIGGDGNDWLDGRGGADVIDGGAGSDWVDYRIALVGVHVDLSQGKAFDDGQGIDKAAYDAAAEVDTLSNVENVRGGGAADRLIGNAADNLFDGGGGNDSISGGDGNDVAIFSGNRADYGLHQLADGKWVVSDLRAASAFDASTGLWSRNDGVDTLDSIEVARFADSDVTLTSASIGGKVYYWKSHAPMAGVSESIQYKGPLGGEVASTLMYELHNVQVGGDGYSAELWVNVSTPSQYLEMQLDLGQQGSATFVAATLPQGWSAMGNVDQGVLRYGSFSLTSLVPQSLKLGEIQLHGISDLSALSPLTFVSGAMGDGVNDVSMQAYQVRVNETTQVSAANGHYQFDDLTAGQYNLDASYAVSNAGAAITMPDALSALKLAAGRNPNASAAVSPYQLIAADVNGDGRVTSADALGILKMYAHTSDAATPTWQFIDEQHDFWNDAVNGVQTMNISRNNVTLDDVLSVDATGSTTVNLVGVLKGDVNGSWAAPDVATTVVPLDSAYFQNLANQLGAPLSQWYI